MKEVYREATMPLAKDSALRKGKDGEVKNLDLVKSAYALLRARPHVQVKWLKGHAGSTWNEYADALAGAWMRR